MYGCVLSIVATDVLMLKHQDISIHPADQIPIALDQFQTKYYNFNEITFWKKNYPCV